MGFLILNAILAVVLFWFASFSEKHFDDEKLKPVNNSIFLAGLIAAITAFAIFAGFRNNKQLIMLSTKFLIIMSAVISTNVCFFLMRYPKPKKNGFAVFMQVVLILFAAVAVFAEVTVKAVSPKEGFSITGADLPLIPLNWFDAIQYLFAGLLPVIAFFSMLFRLRSVKEKNIKQNIILFLLILPFSVASMYVVCNLASETYPAFTMLYPFAVAMLPALIHLVVARSVLFDFKIVIEKVLGFILNYLLASILAGVAFAFLYPLREENILLFLLLFTAVTVALLTLNYQGSKLVRKWFNTRDANYSNRFEQELANLDYSDNSDVLKENILKIFKENVHTSSLDFFIDNGNNELETLFSSRDKKTVISLENPIFDNALNAKRSVIFKSHADSRHSFSGVSKELKEFFEKNEGEVLIILNEGRRIFAAILLGEKHLGNPYTEYDYTTFTNLYSYLFVVGYYLKNIANESVVGTVNREIQMSGQIIQSIQENKDFINNPKVDIGYFSKAAHNLGGEYVDFIRLTDNRYIVVLGDMSGKGINASMSTVILKSIVRTFLSETRDFKQLVQKVNVFIRDNLPKGTYFAGMFGLIDFAEDTLYYINCGVPALFMYTKAYNNIIEIQGEGRVLGFVKNVDRLLKVKKVKLNEGDIIMTCTDGLLEAKSIRGEAFGKDRASKCVIENIPFPAEKVSQFVYDEMIAFTSKELEDDVTVLTMKYLSK